jgi:serine/threonine protein kinase
MHLTIEASNGLANMASMSDLNALDLEPGQIVGGYTLVSRLGGGAMGSVWRVRDDGGQFYAMKILRDSLNEDDETNTGARGISQGDGAADDVTGEHHRSHDPHVTARERMRREALAMRRVHHPGVCAIVDMELDDSFAFLVTELIEGRNLRDDVATNGRYTGDDLERLSRKLIEAVRAVHEQGIIHRDIKPTNVMVSASGPVLVDFGIAMTAGESHMTRTGLVMGTPGFIAPEIIDGEESDEETDWWSLASVLAFAATGRPVFGSKPMMAVLEREASGNANLTGLPPRTLAAFRSALTPDRSKRCTPDDLLRAITLDALNPMDQSEDAYLGGEADGMPLNGGKDETTVDAPVTTPAVNPPSTEVVHPFETGAARPIAGGEPGRGGADNPRTLWTDPIRLATTGSASAGSEVGTQVLTQPTAGDPLPQDDQPTAAEPPRSAVSRESSASAMPSMQDSLTLAMPTEPDDDRGTIALTQAMQPAALADTQYGEAPTAAYESPLAQPAQQAVEPYPMEPAMQALGPNPAAIKRAAMLKRGTLPSWLTALPLALLAAAAPLVAAIVFAALTWLLLTLGNSEKAQLQREGKRGGKRLRRDTFFRATGLPWHVVLSLAQALPRVGIMVLIVGVMPLLVSLISGLPTKPVPICVGPWTLWLPLNTDFAFSFAGLFFGLAMAAAWPLNTFGPQSAMLRLGIGWLRGANGANAPDDGTNRPKANSHTHFTRDWLLFALWFVATLAAALYIAQGHYIDFSPLPTPQP